VGCEIHDAAGHVAPRELLEQGAQPLGQIGAPGADTDQDQIPDPTIALDNLVPNPAQRARDTGPVHDLATEDQMLLGRRGSARHWDAVYQGAPLGQADRTAFGPTFTADRCGSSIRRCTMGADSRGP